MIDNDSNTEPRCQQKFAGGGKINMETRTIFVHPHTLLDSVGEILKKFGAEKFFSSPNEEVKKAREGFAAYFFTLAMKKYKINVKTPQDESREALKSSAPLFK